MNDEIELAKLLKSGSPDDFAEIVRRCQNQIFAILHRYESDFHKLEDLAQETFLKAWRFRDRFDGRAPLPHWLAKIAVHVALDHLRRQKRLRPETPLEGLGDEALEWLRDPHETDRLEASQAAEILQRALRELAPEDRLLITLLELEGRSVREVAQLLAASAVAVRVRAFRIRARLKKILTALPH